MKYRMTGRKRVCIHTGCLGMQHEFIIFNKRVWLCTEHGDIRVYAK